jgi:hypothetical protein
MLLVTLVHADYDYDNCKASDAALGLTEMDGEGWYCAKTRRQFLSLAKCVAIDYWCVVSCQGCTQAMMDSVRLTRISSKDPDGGFSLIIQKADPITSVEGLSGLSGALEGGLKVAGMANLRNLTGLGVVSSVGTCNDGNSVFLDSNPELDNTLALEHTKYPAGSLYIINNRELDCVPTRWEEKDRAGNTIRQGKCDAPTSAPTDAPTNAPTDAPTIAPTDAPTDGYSGVCTLQPEPCAFGLEIKTVTDCQACVPKLGMSYDDRRFSSPEKAPQYCHASLSQQQYYMVKLNTAAGIRKHQQCYADCNTAAPKYYNQYVCKTQPTIAPTDAPTASPTDPPTDTPTGTPTDAPTASPTDAPTVAPTAAPTAAPTPGSIRLCGGVARGLRVRFEPPAAIGRHNGRGAAPSSPSSSSSPVEAVVRQGGLVRLVSSWCGLATLNVSWTGVRRTAPGQSDGAGGRGSNRSSYAATTTGDWALDVAVRANVSEPALANASTLATVVLTRISATAVKAAYVGIFDELAEKYSPPVEQARAPGVLQLSAAHCADCGHRSASARRPCNAECERRFAKCIPTMYGYRFRNGYTVPYQRAWEACRGAIDHDPQHTNTTALLARRAGLNLTAAGGCPKGCMSTLQMLQESSHGPGVTWTGYRHKATRRRRLMLLEGAGDGRQRRGMEIGTETAKGLLQQQRQQRQQQQQVGWQQRRWQWQRQLQQTPYLAQCIADLKTEGYRVTGATPTNAPPTRPPTRPVLCRPLRPPTRRRTRRPMRPPPHPPSETGAPPRLPRVSVCSKCACVSGARGRRTRRWRRRSAKCPTMWITSSSRRPRPSGGQAR